MQLHRRTAEVLTTGQAGAQPFEPALPVLGMNRPAGRFTSSASTGRQLSARILACRRAVKNPGAQPRVPVAGRTPPRRRMRFKWGTEFDLKNELFWVCAGWRWGVFYW